MYSIQAQSPPLPRHPLLPSSLTLLVNAPVVPTQAQLHPSFLPSRNLQIVEGSFPLLRCLSVVLSSDLSSSFCLFCPSDLPSPISPFSGSSPSLSTFVLITQKKSGHQHDLRPRRITALNTRPSPVRESRPPSPFNLSSQLSTPRNPSPRHFRWSWPALGSPFGLLFHSSLAYLHAFLLFLLLLAFSLFSPFLFCLC